MPELHLELKNKVVRQRQKHKVFLNSLPTMSTLNLELYIEQFFLKEIQKLSYTSGKLENAYIEIGRKG